MKRIPFVIGVLALLVSGCGSFQAASLPLRVAHTRANRQEKMELTVAAELHASPERVHHYFGGDLWDAGYFPVVLYLENRGSNTFEIQRGSISLELERTRTDTTAGREDRSSGRLAAVSPARVVAACQQSEGKAFLLLPLLFFPALVARAEIASYNFHLTEDLLDKSFPAYYRLEPGDTQVCGALFFRRPESSADLDEVLKSAELRLQAEVEGSRIQQGGTAPRRVGETITFVVSLSDREY